MRRAANTLIPRREVEQALYPADLIGYTILDLLEELIPWQDEPGTLDVETLGVGARWDALPDAFSVSAWIETKQ